MRDPDCGDAERDAGVPQRPMPAWAIWFGLGVLIIAATVSIVVLFNFYGEGTEQDRVRLDILQMTGSIVLGAGGLFALLRAARRQRTNEMDLAHRRQVASETKEREEQAADDARKEALERHITDLYSSAAEQLGSEKAPVRIAAMLTLDRLGQDNPEHQQAVMNLLCAYLRMPFSWSGRDDRSDSTEKRESVAEVADEDSRRELEVRLTAQRLLTVHSSPGEDGDRSERHYWPYMELDLTGAVLVQWNMNNCRVGKVSFRGARFYGDSVFDRAVFGGAAVFSGAQFCGETSFRNAKFSRIAWFDRSEFSDYASFSSAKFHGKVRFDRAHFLEECHFSRCCFHEEARIRDAVFRGLALFVGTEFRSEALFSGVRFHQGMWMDIAALDERVDLNLEGALAKSRFQCFPPSGWRTVECTNSEDKVEGWRKIVPDALE